MTTRLSAREAIASVTDPGTFTELPAPLRVSPADGPLEWTGYDGSRARAAERTGEQESVVTGTALVGGHEATVISFEFGFLGGSLGQRTGDRLEAAYAHAREHRLPWSRSSPPAAPGCRRACSRSPSSSAWPASAS